MPRSPISLDNANMEKNLEIKMLVKGASELLESARPSTKTLPNSLWCSSNQSGGTSCQDFEFEKEKSKWEVKRNTMKSEATRLKEMVKQANADCEKVLAAKEKAKESHTQVFGEKVELEEQLKKMKQNYKDLEYASMKGLDDLVENLKAHF
ncbi:hypothetical protein S245_055215 [Arachis hypogaea]